MITKALILAAGAGKRLDRPNTLKPLVKVGENPLIFRLIDQLAAAGITTIYIVVGYEKEKIIKAVSSHYVTRLDIRFVECENWSEGISRSALAARGLFTEPFILSMGDHYFDDSHIQLMVSRHPGEGEVHLLVDTRENPEINIDSAVKVQCVDSKIIAISDVLKDFNGIDAGLFAAAPGALLSHLEHSISQGSSRTLSAGLSGIASQNLLTAVPMESGVWYDVDTPLDLVAAEMAYRKSFRTRFVKPLPKHNENFESFDFIAGKPVTTTMLVGRGLFKNPESMSVIPPDAASSPIFVFTDNTVGPLYGIPFEQSLREQGYRSHLLIMADGEESKSLANYVDMTQKVLSLGVDERSVFISIGGGVVCNVCGFIASTIYRGLDLVHLPTSLMAQSDAAISHKQAINGHMGKNMVGSYFSPRMVVVDVETLLTLDTRLIHDGMAEVIKHALGQEQSYVDLLLNYRGDFVRDLDLLEAVIRRNVRLKCALSKDDPKELSAGMVLQYGHTVGHPVEHLSGYTLYHGESVAIGMMVAARVARIMGGCDQSLVDLHEELLTKFGLPVKVPRDISSSDMLKTLKYNKRYLTEGTRMALLSSVGNMWQVHGDYAIPVPQEVLVEAFNQSKE
ncbi:NTP transferase domain-containing protein [Myxococcota bacterium]|nr:NTP transferase domain-containing protein [Myxococcota bacterium]